jgi:hypothetical protein
MTPLDLDTRLAALEDRVPAEDAPHFTTAGRPRRHALLSLAAAPILVLALAATAVGAAGVIRIITVSTAAVDQGSLASAGLECMTPPEAAAWLASHGYDHVLWNTAAGHGTIGAGAGALPVLPADPGASIDLGSPGPGGGAGTASAPEPSESRTPPTTGVVVAAIPIDGTVHVAVDITPGAERAPTCPVP